jgi:hypothetical protein
MKKTFCFIFLLMPALIFAQQYTIDWSKVAGGGGTSTGSVYSLSGTIGQPDASSAMTGGNYSITGGFWALYAVQTPSAPLLTITRSGTSVIVSWPTLPTGFSLQQNGTLNSANWTDFGGTVNSNSTTMSVSIPMPTGNLFFRLKSP